MADDRNKPRSRRSIFADIAKALGLLALATPTLSWLTSSIFQWRDDQRKQAEHDLALADRQQGQVVEVGVAEESDSALPIVAVRADQKGHLPTSKGSITVDPTIPI